MKGGERGGKRIYCRKHPEVDRLLMREVGVLAEHGGRATGTRFFGKITGPRTTARPEVKPGKPSTERKTASQEVRIARVVALCPSTTMMILKINL